MGRKRVSKKQKRTNLEKRKSALEREKAGMKLVKTNGMSGKRIGHLFQVVHNMKEKGDYLEKDDENRQRFSENAIENISSTNETSADDIEMLNENFSFFPGSDGIKQNIHSECKECSTGKEINLGTCAVCDSFEKGKRNCN